MEECSYPQIWQKHTKEKVEDLREKIEKLLPEDKIIFRIYTISITQTQRTSGINDIKFYFSFMERPQSRF